MIALLEDQRCWSRRHCYTVDMFHHSPAFHPLWYVFAFVDFRLSPPGFVRTQHPLLHAVLHLLRAKCVSQILELLLGRQYVQPWSRPDRGNVHFLVSTGANPPHTCWFWLQAPSLRLHHQILPQLVQLLFEWLRIQQLSAHMKLRISWSPPWHVSMWSSIFLFFHSDSTFHKICIVNLSPSPRASTLHWRMHHLKRKVFSTFSKVVWPSKSAIYPNEVAAIHPWTSWSSIFSQYASVLSRRRTSWCPCWPRPWWVSFSLPLQQLRHQCLKGGLTANTVNPTHVQMLPSFRPSFSCQAKKYTGRTPLRHRRRYGKSPVTSCPCLWCCLRFFSGTQVSLILKAFCDLWHQFDQLAYDGIFWSVDFFWHFGPCLQHKSTVISATLPCSVKCLSPFYLYLIIHFSCFSIVSLGST